MSISTPNDHKMKGGKILFQLGDGFDQVLMTFNVGEPSDRSNDLRPSWTAKPVWLLFPLSSCPPESLTVDPARDHSEPVELTDLSIKMILPFRFCQRNEPIRQYTQPSFDLKKQPGTEWTEMAVEHMAVWRMNDDRHPCEPSRHSAQYTSLRCMSMDQYRLFLSEQTNQFPQGLCVLDRMDLSRQCWKQHPTHVRLIKSPTILLSCGLPALRIPTTWIPGNDQRLELHTVMTERGQHRILGRPAMIQARNDMNHLPRSDRLMPHSRSILRQAHEQSIKVCRMRCPIVSPLHGLATFLRQALSLTRLTAKPLQYQS